MKPEVKSQALPYRPEIDGLRALAVLMVVANHVGYGWASGGYLGVDVFFVISGYLITRIIVNETEQGLFSFRQFYLRRIRRILPALYFVLIVSFPLAIWLMLPSELAEFSRATIGAIGFFINLILWRQGGYFDVDAELKPLLHLWSLAVEEQFYAVFPLLMFYLLKFRRFVVVMSLGGVALSSFMLLLMLRRDMPRASFYLAPTRIWEILLGAVVGLQYFQTPSAHRNLLRWRAAATSIGLTLILCSALLLVENYQYSFPVTVVPVLGAVLVVWFGGTNRFLEVVLCWQPLRVIGLASYSIYLVHQPILVFGRRLSGDFVDSGEREVLLLGILLLGILLWRIVELNFRDKQRMSTSRLLTATAVVSIALVVSGFFVERNEGFPSRLAPNIKLENASQRLLTVCGSSKEFVKVTNLEVCQFGDSTGMMKVVVLGDSHADTLITELNQLFVGSGIQGQRIKMGSCSEIPGSYLRQEVPEDKSKCEAAFEQMLDHVRSEEALVIVSLRWTFRLFPIPDQIEQLEASNSEGGHELEDFREYVIATSENVFIDAKTKATAVKRLIDGLSISAPKVLIVGPVPEVAWNIARLNQSYFMARRELLQEISFPYSDFVKRNQFIESVLEPYHADRADNVEIVEPSKVFCNTYLSNRCVAQWGTKPFYFDDDHLSDLGVQLLIPVIRTALGQL